MTFAPAPPSLRRMIRWLLLLLGIVALTLFVLANPGATSLRLWPGGMLVEAQGWTVFLGCALLGFLLGAGVVWAAHLPRMRRLTRLERSAALLESEVAERRRAASPGVPPRPAPVATGTAVRVR